MPGLSKAVELRRDRAVLHTRMLEITEKPGGEGGSLSPEQRSEWDKLHEKQESLLADALRHEENERLEIEMAKETRVLAGKQDDNDRMVLGTEEQREQQKKVDGAFDSYIRRGFLGLKPEERSIMEGRHSTIETRAQGTDPATAGGYLIPEGFYNKLIEARKWFGGMRQCGATLVPTSTGNTIPIPTDNDTTNTGSLLAENTAETELAITVGSAMLYAWTYSSRIVLVSRQLLQDSAFPIDTYLTGKFAQRLGRVQNTHFTTGDASSKPQGVVTGATSGASGATGQTTTIIYDDLVTLEHSVDRDYRQGASVGWMMNDSTLKVLKQLKDGIGRPLWAPGIGVGTPDQILGYRYTVNNDVAAMAASAKSLLFGDFSSYFIRDVSDTMILRLEERYAEYLQVGFLAFSRCDGKLVDAGTHPIKYYSNSAS